MEILPFFVLAVLAIVVILPLAYHLNAKAGEAWADAARRLGIGYDPGGFARGRSMTGSISGCGVTIDTYKRSSGKSSTTYMRFRVAHRHGLGLGLRLTREGFLSGVTKFFGAQDVRTGDARFDEAVTVKGAEPRAIVEFLTPERRVRVHRVLSSCDGAVIDDGGITWSRRGVLRDAERIVRVVRVLVRTSTALTADPGADPDALSHALDERWEGRPQAAFDVIERRVRRRRRAERSSQSSKPERTRRQRPPREPSRPEPPRPEPTPEPPELEPAAVPIPVPPIPAPPTPEPPEIEPVAIEVEPEGPDVDEDLARGELLYLGGRREEAAEAFRDALESAPEDAEIRAWAEHAAAAPGAPTQDRDAEEASPPSLDVCAVCDGLFREGRSSIDAQQEFESRYAGQSVRWTGTLRRAEKYSFDFVFGSEPGGKAVLEVHEVATSVYGNRQVFAVVRLPEECVAGLQARRGETVTFEGRLSGIDAMMRNLYVEDGRLVD